MKDEQLSANFKRSEFLTDYDYLMLGAKKAKDIIGRVATKLIPLLQRLRDFIGRVDIHCGYRNEEHNKEVGGKQFSHHRYFNDTSACDFHCADMQKGWDWFKQHRSEFCYCYWDKDKNFFHLSGLTEKDPRIGAMWIVVKGKNYHE